MAIFNIDGKKVSTGNAHYNTFSVLSDSYSAYNGFVEPSVNATWYPAAGVTTVEGMWYHLFARSYGSALQMNNSYSGSRIANDPNVENSKTTSFVARMNNIGKPELIFILGGTNDSWNGVTIGDFKYSDWTEDDLQSFRPSVAYMLDYLLHHNVGAKILFLLNLFQESEDVYFTSIKTICEYYKVDVIDLSSITKTQSHPDAQGMMMIRDKIMDHLGEERHIVNEITGNWSFPYEAGSSMRFANLSESFEQYRHYRFELDGFVSSSDAYFEIYATQDRVFAKFQAGQNGKVVVEGEATQSDAVKTACIRCVNGTGTVNSLKIYEVSYDA